MAPYDTDIVENMPARADDGTDVAPGSAGRPTTGEVFHNILQRRLERRAFLRGSAVAGVAMSVATPSFLAATKADAQVADALTFTPIPGSGDDQVNLPEGYDHKVMIRWGDALFNGAEDLDVATLWDPATSELLQPDAAERQEQWFGYNCDFNGYFPLPAYRYLNSSAGLFCTNHEYTNEEIMFVGYEGSPAGVRQYVLDHPVAVQVAQAAHGVSVVEIRRTDGRGRDRQWEYVKGSSFNRRITATTPMEITGPAAGDPLLATAADASGTRVLGTLNNCAGGITPWGTLITCEENFDQYFGNFSALEAAAEAAGPDSDLARYVEVHRRIPVPSGQSSRAWEVVDPRFDLAENPTEPFRFGWVVEIDPYDPASTPKKRSALGRFKHEGCTSTVAPDGRVAFYSGDDARFEYFYKFVTRGTFDPEDRTSNMDLLDDGILYVAKFNDDGSGEWLPLVFGQNGLTEENGFNNQAEVLIAARAAGDIVGATPLDRPEDTEPSPQTGKVYITLTGNTRRDGSGDGMVTAQGRDVPSDADFANPRGGEGTGGNPLGHLLELQEAGDDPTATTFTWDVFILCGNPSGPEGSYLTSIAAVVPPLGSHDTYFAGYPVAAEISALAAPDNIAFDRRGNLWISTDGQYGELNLAEPINDGVYACPTEGANRGRTMRFLTGVIGCEICGPEFTPDSTSFFCGIQHPGQGGSLVEGIPSDWPDRGGNPPRPSVISVIKPGGRRTIGA